MTATTVSSSSTVSATADDANPTTTTTLSPTAVASVQLLFDAENDSNNSNNNNNKSDNNNNMAQSTNHPDDPAGIKSSPAPDDETATTTTTAGTTTAVKESSASSSPETSSTATTTTTTSASSPHSSSTTTTTTTTSPTGDAAAAAADADMDNNATDSLANVAAMSSSMSCLSMDATLQGPTGCYLIYEPHSGGRLVIQYSKGPVPPQAVGFWMPGAGQAIQEFKFKQGGGRCELIKGIAGGDANRRKYFVGWCLFFKLAKAKQGRVIQFTPASACVPVDVYGFHQKTLQPLYLDLEAGLVSLTHVDAVAVMPKHHTFLAGVKTIAVSNFLELGNLAGATTRL